MVGVGRPFHFSDSRPFRFSGSWLMRTLFLGLVLAGIWLPSPTPLAAESADATIRTATQQAVWRRTTAGWERSIDWPRNSASAELTAAAAIHPSIVGLLQLGLIFMAFLLFPAGSMQRSDRKRSFR